MLNGNKDVTKAATGHGKKLVAQNTDEVALEFTLDNGSYMVSWRYKTEAHQRLVFASHFAVCIHGVL